MKRQLKQLERTAHFFETVITDEEPVEIKLMKPCLECGKGMLREFEVVGRTFATCDTCNHREKIK